MTRQAAGASATRDWLVDLLRVVSMLVVILMHWNLMRVVLAEDGSLKTVPALHGPAIMALTWALQVMPLLFILGGFANTVVHDRGRAGGDGLGDFLGLRARRLLTPLVPLIAFTAPAVAVAGAISPVLAGVVDDHVSNPLWFLWVYLLCTALTPLMTRLHDRLGWAVPALLLAGSLLVDGAGFAGDGRWVSLNFLLVWLACHQLGILYARGALRRWPGWALLAVGAAAVGALVVMVVAGPWPPTNIQLVGHPTTNLVPPTSAMTVLALAQLVALTAGRRALGDWEPQGRLRALIARANALIMVIYLWQVPALVVVSGLGLLWPEVLLPTGEAAWVALRPLWWALAGLMLTAMVWLGLRWELLCQRLLARSATVPVVLGTAAGIVGVAWMWSHHGVGLSTAVWPGTLLTLLGTALLTTLRPLPRAHPA